MAVATHLKIDIEEYDTRIRTFIPYYEEMLDAVFPEGPVPAKPPGRNDPCPCGSGKKYKKCCGRAAGPDASVPERDDGGDPAGPSLHVG